MPTKAPWSGQELDYIRDLRHGTRVQYESDWVFIGNGTKVEFRHDLGELPWIVNVLRSENEDGSFPVDADADITLVKSDIDGTAGSGEDTLYVQNDLADDENAYFKVRAM